MDFLSRASDDATFYKVLFAIIAGVIWLVSTIVASINKRAEQARRQQQYGQLPPDVRRPTLPPPPVPRQAQRPAQKQKQKPRPAPAQRPQTVVAREEPMPGRVVADTASAQPQASSRAGSRASAAATPAASKIGRLVRRPDSLRAALILSEVIAKPISLRNSDGQGV